MASLRGLARQVSTLRATGSSLMVPSTQNSSPLRRPCTVAYSQPAEVNISKQLVVEAPQLWDQSYTTLMVQEHLKARQLLRLDGQDSKAALVAYYRNHLSLQHQHLLLCAASPAGAKPTAPDSGRPLPEQLQRVANVLAETLPRLFIQPMDYTIYAQDIIFDNRIRGTRTTGLYNYVKQVALLRCVGHLKYAYVRFQILKLTQHPEEGTVKVRWRISGISGLKILFTFWRYKLWQWKELMDKQESWFDGFSTFHVSSDGSVYLHVADKMMPDDEKLTDGRKTAVAATNAALLLGAVPQANWNDTSPLIDQLFFFQLIDRDDN